MKNINKYTKAELISKIKGLNSKQNENNSSLFTNLMNFLLLFKSFILKITLIALIIKVFKKFSIFRRIWSFFNLILFSIFGISLIDIYEIEILSNFLHNILDIFSKIHTNILELFGKKVEIPVEFPSKMGSMKRIDQSSNGNKESNKIIERFNKIIHNEPETIQEVETIQEDTPLYKNKYVIIGGILVLACLSWYFYDDLKPIGSSILATIHSFRSRPDPDSDGSNGNIQGNIKSNIRSIKDKIYQRIYGKDDSNNPPSPGNPIELLDPNNKGKTIDFGELSQSEIERRGGLLYPQLTGLRDITGNSFTEESAAVLQEINTFNNHNLNETFPDTKLQRSLYNVIRDRLLKLSQVSESKYNDLIQDEQIENKINNFVNLEEALLSPESTHTPWDQDSPGSHTYNEIALATIQEKDVWSEPALSPRENLLSPIPLERDLKHTKERLEMYEKFAKDKLTSKESANLEERVLESAYKDIFKEDVPFEIKTAEFLNKQEEKNWSHLFKITDDLDNKDLKDSIKETFKEIIPLESEIIDEINKDKLPETNINKDSGSDSSMDHYFPKIVESTIDVKTVDPKAEHNPLFDQIKSKRLEYGTPEAINKEVTASPNVGNIGLQTPIQDRLNTSPLIHKTSISNMFDDTMNLFEDDNDDIDISDKAQDSIQASSKDLNPQIEVKNKPGYGKSFLDSINALRKEYDSHEKEKLILNEEHTLESKDNSDDSAEEELWKDVKVKLNNDITNRFVDIDFGDLRDKVYKILIITNDGESNYFNPNLDGYNKIQTFRWDNKGMSNFHYKDLEVTNIYIMEQYDKDGKTKFRTHNIFHSKPQKIIGSYLESVKDRYWK